MDGKLNIETKLKKYKTMNRDDIRKKNKLNIKNVTPLGVSLLLEIDAF